MSEEEGRKRKRKWMGCYRQNSLHATVKWASDSQKPTTSRRSNSPENKCQPNVNGRCEKKEEAYSHWLEESFTRLIDAAPYNCMSDESEWKMNTRKINFSPIRTQITTQTRNERCLPRSILSKQPKALSSGHSKIEAIHCSLVMESFLNLTWSWREWSDGLNDWRIHLKP